MIHKIIPASVRMWLRNKIREAALNGTNLPLSAMKYIPYKHETSSYFLPKKPHNGREVYQPRLPIPPKEQYLVLGEVHVRCMLETISTSDFSLNSGDRILDFGCGSGRMIRHLKSE